MKFVETMLNQKLLWGTLLALGTGAAAAQGSVTIGGVMDVSARSVKNDGSSAVQSLASGANSTSRLYFRGEEDLGAGLSAGFWLETGINVDSGATTGGTQFYDRRATLSLTSRSAGEIRMGRDYVPTYTTWSRHDPFSHVGVAGSNNFSTSSQQGPIRAAFGTNPNTTVRANNAVEYLLPAGLGGLEGGLMVAAGEGGTTANGQDKVVAARIGWQGPWFGVNAAHGVTENDLMAGGKFKDSVLGVNGAIGPVKLAAAWRRYEQASAEQTNVMLSGIASFGAVDVKASYLKANLKGSVGATVIDANDASQFGVGAVYNFSKRTAAYAQASRLANDGRATFVIPGGATLSAGGTSTGWEAGLRHNF